MYFDSLQIVYVYKCTKNTEGIFQYKFDDEK